MLPPSKLHSSKNIDRAILPPISKDKQQKQLSNTISRYVTEVSNSVEDFERYRDEFDISQLPKPKTKSSCIDLNSLRHKRISIPTKHTKSKSRFCVNKEVKQSQDTERTIFEATPIKNRNHNSFISFPKISSKSSTSMPRVAIHIKKNQLLEELKSIDEESNYVNQHMLTDLSVYDKDDRRLNGQYVRIIDEKNKMLDYANEFLQPDYNHPFQNHSNEFYTVLDQVITKINGTTSVDLFKRMKQISGDKIKKEGVNNLKVNNQSERLEKILNDSALISNRLIKKNRKFIHAL